MQKVSFTVDNQKLNGTLFYPENPKEQNPAILFIHGFTGSQDTSFQYANALTRWGFICMTFDLRGHGASEGDINSLTREDFLKDVVSAYNFLIHQMGVDPEEISVVGSSFGAYLSLLLSSMKEIKNVVLRVPANYPNVEFDKPQINQGNNNPLVKEWRNEPKKVDEAFSLEAINNFVGKILIVEAEKDDIIPHQTIENYINAVKDKTKLTHIVVKGAPHSIKEGRFRDEVTKILADWFGDKI